MVVRSTGKTRERALNIISKRHIFWFRPSHNRVDAVVRGSEKDYLVNLDFEHHHFGDFVDGSMLCDCEAFTFRDGPCKHIVAVAAEAITRIEGGDATTWMREVCSESRNSGEQYKPWERKPQIDEEIAKVHNATVEVVKKHRKEIRCYSLKSGMFWTGSLPLPEIGESIKAKLPTGDEIDAEVLREFSEDENSMLGYWVRLEDAPDIYKNDEIVLYGSEMIRRASDD